MLTGTPQVDRALLCHDWLSADIRSSDVFSPVRERIHSFPCTENTGIPLLELTDPSRHPAKWRVPRAGCSTDNGVSTCCDPSTELGSSAGDVTAVEAGGTVEATLGEGTPVPRSSVLVKSCSKRSIRSNSWVRCSLLVEVSKITSRGLLRIP